MYYSCKPSKYERIIHFKLCMQECVSHFEMCKHERIIHFEMCSLYACVCVLVCVVCVCVCPCMLCLCVFPCKKLIGCMRHAKMRRQLIRYCYSATCTCMHIHTYILLLLSAVANHVHMPSCFDPDISSVRIPENKHTHICIYTRLPVE